MSVKVSIVMPVYNGEKYLKIAIDSILNQSFKDFEFIIIDDGSSDKSTEIIRLYNDERIVFIKNTINMGLIFSLNLGLESAKGKYIARMDQDDKSYLNRIEEQVKYMDEHPEIILTSTNARLFNESGFSYLLKKKITLEKLKTNLLFSNCIVHPSVMLRKDYLKDYNLNYDLEYKGIEDYGLWLKMSIQNAKLAIIPKVLLDYRINIGSITTNNLKDLKDYIIRLSRIFYKELNYANFEITNEEAKLHAELFLIEMINQNFSYSIGQVENYFQKIVEKNKEYSTYNKEILKEELITMLIKCIVINGKFNDLKKSYFYEVRNYNFFKYFLLKSKFILKIRIKKLLR